eukprot:scaffold111147_cov24-Phaeocystis_antarctica.AAC.1
MEAAGWRLQAGGCRLEAASWRLQAGGCRLEAAASREAGGRRLEAAGRRPRAAGCRMRRPPPPLAQGLRARMTSVAMAILSPRHPLWRFDEAGGWRWVSAPPLPCARTCAGGRCELGLGLGL